MSPTIDSVTFSVPAVAESVPYARRRIAAIAADARASEEKIDEVSLAVTEAVTNAVRHAYDVSDGRVHLSASVDGRQLSVLVVDDGCGLGNSRVRDGLGLGLTVIERLSDSVSFATRTSGGVEVEMSFVLTSRADMDPPTMPAASGCCASTRT